MEVYNQVALIENYNRSKMEKLPLHLKQKLQDINKKVNLRALLKTNLTLDTLSSSLCVSKNLLEKLNAQENLIQPLLKIPDFEKRFNRDLKDAIDDIDLKFNKAVKSYELTSEFDDFSSQLIKYSKDASKVEKNQKKIKKYFKEIQELISTQEEKSQIAEKSVKTLVNELKDMQDEIQKAQKGISTFCYQVKGSIKDVLEKISDLQNKIITKQDEIRLSTNNINSLQNKQKLCQQMINEIESCLINADKEIIDQNTSINQTQQNIILQDKFIQINQKNQNEMVIEKKNLEQRKADALNIKQKFETEYNMKRNEYLKKIEEMQNQIKNIRISIEQEKRMFWDWSNFKVDSLQRQQNYLQQCVQVLINELAVYQNKYLKEIQPMINKFNEEISLYEQAIKLLESEQNNHQIVIQQQIVENNNKQTEIISYQGQIEKLKIMRNNYNQKLQKSQSEQQVEQKNLNSNLQNLELIKEELKKYENQFEECMESYSQLDRLEIPEEVLNGFEAIYNTLLAYQLFVGESKLNIIKKVEETAILTEKLSNRERQIKKNAESDSEDEYENDDEVKKNREEDHKVLHDSLKDTLNQIKESLDCQAITMKESNDQIQSQFKRIIDQSNHNLQLKIQN